MKKRIDYLDIVRGICILYMISGHIFFEYSWWDHYIHAFHMPIFFLISGFFFKKSDNIVEYLKKMSKKILVPYFIWAFVALLVDRFTTLGPHIGTRMGLQIVLTSNNNVIPIAGALWFLTSFFFCHTLFTTIQSKINSKTIKGILVTICGLIGIYLYRYTKIDLWWSLNSALLGVSLMEIGYLVKEKEWIEKIKIKNCLLLIGLFFINTFLIMKTGYVNMRISTYPNIILFFFNLLLVTIIYIGIALKIEKLSISKYITLFGKESIIPLCTNQLIIVIYRKILFHFFRNVSGLYLFGENLLIFVLSLITIFGIIKISNNSKIRFLFGKKH